MISIFLLSAKAIIAFNIYSFHIFTAAVIIKSPRPSTIIIILYFWYKN